MLLKPKYCFRKYYKLEKFECNCNCIIKCKYPPPSTPIAIVQYNHSKTTHNL